LSNNVGYLKIQELRDLQVAAIRALSEGNNVFIGTKTGSDKSLAYECFPLVVIYVAIGAPYSGCIQSNRLARAFEFAARYIKGEEKVQCICTGSKLLVREDEQNQTKMFKLLAWKVVTIQHNYMYIF